jgi:hypothetical protein
MKLFRAAFVLIVLIALNLSSARADALCGSTVYVQSSAGAHLVGVVLSKYDTTIEVRWDLRDGLPYRGPSVFLQASQVSVEGNCSDSVCAGDTVYLNSTSGDHYIGAVRRIFSNGIAEIEWVTINAQPVSLGLRYIEASSLSLPGDCYGGICENDEVMGIDYDHDIFIGIVKRVFSSGVAEVEWSRKNGNPIRARTSYWRTHRLTRRTSDCSSAGR